MLLPFPATQEGIAGQFALADAGENRIETKVILFFISLLWDLGAPSFGEQMQIPRNHMWH